MTEQKDPLLTQKLQNRHDIKAEFFKEIVFYQELESYVKQASSFSYSGNGQRVEIPETDSVQLTLKYLICQTMNRYHLTDINTNGPNHSSHMADQPLPNAE